MSTLRIAWSLASARAAIGCALVTGLLLCTVPLFGVHGVESALVLGLTLPLPCALLGARVALRLRVGAGVTTGALLATVLSVALTVLAVPVLLLALNALRVRACEPIEGLLFIALGPGFGVLLAALLGALAGSLPVRAGVATALALAAPLLELCFGLYELYSTPAVFAYGQLFGYFPGSLYDELVEIPWPLLLMRMQSALAIVALVGALHAHRDAVTGTLRLRPRPGARLLCALWLSALLLFVWSQAKRESFGQASSTAHVANVLGARHQSARCVLYVPRELRADRRTRLGDDCDFRLAQLERFLGVRVPGKVRVLLFRSAGEKKQLMGAAGTNIAKPWRREIYLQDDALPHPVLAHELAHVVAAEFGRGPMRITGPLGGLYPDLGLIEGVAVAAAWSSSAPSGLTPHQWARAMLELELVPPLSELLGTSFLAQQRRLAYTLVGSIVRYVADTRGAKTVRALYGSGDVPGALGISLAQLERDWRKYVSTVPLPPSARARAALRFSGGSVLSGICPHARAALKDQLAGELAATDDRAAERSCQALLEIDATDVNVRATLAQLLARKGDLRGAHTELLALERAGYAGAPLLFATRHLMADEAVRRGKLAEARMLYESLLDAPLERDALRLLQVKALAFSGSSQQQALLFALLVGEVARPPGAAVAVHLARELRAARDDGLARYLEARQLLFEERYEIAALLLAEARARGLPTLELRAEALRTEAFARFWLRQWDESDALLRELLTLPAELGMSVEASDLRDRIAFTRKRS